LRTALFIHSQRPAWPKVQAGGRSTPWAVAGADRSPPPAAAWRTNMPAMNGLAFLMALKLHRNGKSTPVVITVSKDGAGRCSAPPAEIN